MLATAIAQASGLPMNVGPCMSAPWSEREMVSATSSVQSMAARVRYPPVRALPTHRMSGVMPAASLAKRVPVRPKPVAISSQMSRTSCRRVISRRAAT